jgi:CHASE2 domain-containing sensor protein
MPFKTKPLLIALLIASLVMTAAGSIFADNWVMRTPPLAMLVCLAVFSVYILSPKRDPRKSPFGEPHL